jgi:predicted transcriptional regulator
MVTVNIPISEDVLERLRDLAEKTGRTVEQAAADLLTSLATDEGIELTEEQEAAIEAADAEIDRGEYVTEQALFAKLRAQRG